MKAFFKSFFGASGKEITGLLLLAVVLMFTLLVTKAFDFFGPGDTSYTAEDRRILDSLMVLLANDSANARISKKDTVFSFNPNTVSRQELLRLGFDDKVASRIINYRNKGGVFTVKADLYKIYAIDSVRVGELYAYIDLPATITRQGAMGQTNREKVIRHPAVTTQTQVSELPKFDINKADTAMLQTINGIGSVLSKRIIEFRDKLGGFVAAQQLYEVYNLDSAVVMRLLSKAYIEKNFQPELLPVNKAGIEELAAHPYISWQQARLIVAYRSQHGDYTSAADLQQVYAIDEHDVKRLAPYIDWSPTN